MTAMAKYHGTTLSDALQRWEESHVRSIDTEMRTGAGLPGASMLVTTGTAEVELLVTNVRALGQSYPVDEVHDVFTQFVHAPTDAALLASEVKRLAAEVRRLKDEAKTAG